MGIRSGVRFAPMIPAVWATAVVNYINQNGGMGRAKVDLVLQGRSTTDNQPADDQADCTAFTEDHPVFAAFGVSTLEGSLAWAGCLAAKHVVLPQKANSPVSRWHASSELRAGR